MEPHFISGRMTALVYALTAAALLIAGAVNGDIWQLKLAGLGFVVLAVVQGWLCARKSGHNRGRHANLLLGPANALLGISWLLSGMARDDKWGMILGGWFLVSAVGWGIDGFRTLTRDKSNQ